MTLTQILWMLLVALLVLAPEVRRISHNREAKSKVLTCSHSEWVEVLSVEHKLVSYLCLNEACERPLYAVEWVREGDDIWKPASCSCEPLQQKYLVRCPVKNHSGWARVLEAINAPVHRATHSGSCACPKCFERSVVKAVESVSCTEYQKSKFGIIETYAKQSVVEKHLRYKNYKHDKEILMRAMKRKKI